MRRVFTPQLKFPAPTLLLALAVLASGFGIPVTFVTAARAQSQDLRPYTFYPYRPKGLHGHRDLEFQWDTTYVQVRGDTSPIPPDIQKTLDNLAQTMCEDYSNPLGAQISDIELVWDYLFPLGDIYNRDAAAPVGLREVCFDYWQKLSQVKSGADTTHIDVYIFAPGHAGLGGGTTPSPWRCVLEDTSTGHVLVPLGTYGDVYGWNSVAFQGPPVSPTSGIADTSGTGWTRGNQGANPGVLHEMAHTFNPGAYLPGTPQGINNSNPAMNELFSSTAEELVGETDPPPPEHFEVPYTWPVLCVNRGSRQADSVLTVGTNYQNWRSLGAYLLYNFQGTNTQPTLAGFRDDLFYKFAHGTPTVLLNDDWGPHLVYPRTFRYFRTLLSDDSCSTCAAKSYFHPGGQASNSVDRFGLLMHNWRVANYVNQPALAEGQFGFPSTYGFWPASNLNAWHSSDGVVNDDIIAVPPEVTLSRTGPNRTLVRSKARTVAGGTFSIPMQVQHMGAEYWIVRSDASLATGGPFTLRARVAADGIWRSRVMNKCGQPDSSVKSDNELRLVASAIGYTNAASTDSLWRHPEWAAYVSSPQFVDVDSLEAPITLTIPNFGTTYKAALITITASTGRHAEPPDSAAGSTLDTWYEFSGDPPAFSGRLALWRNVPYRVSFTVVDGTQLPSEPTLVANESAVSETSPSWRPAANEIDYVRKAGSGRSQIYRKAVGGSATAVYGTSDDELDPDWSPRGDLISFVRGDMNVASPTTELWIATLSSTATQLTTSGGLKRSPVFNPNGRTVAYANAYPVALPQGGQQTQWGIWTIPTTGGAPTQVLGTSLRFQISSIRWSPDGKQIWFLSNDSLYVITVSNGSVVNRTATLPTVTKSFDLHRTTGPIAVEQTVKYPFLYSCSPGAAESFRRVGQYDSARVDVDPVLYVRGSTFTGPRWSIDGTKLAYSVTTAAGDPDILMATANTDHAPVFSAASYADATIPPCQQFQRTLSATDADGETPSFEAACLPSGAGVTGNLLRWNPTSTQIGDFYITIRAKDASGGLDQRVVRLTVDSDTSGCNCPPHKICGPNRLLQDVPTEFALGPNVPNPFRHSTSIRFDLPSTQHVRLEIFDLFGRRVRTLVDGELSAAHHSVEWDMRDERGNAVQAGIFVYRITAGTFRAQRTMVGLGAR